MKNLIYSLIILTIILEILSAEETANDLSPNNRHLCDQNNGNIQIKTVFRLKSHLFFFGEDNQKFKLSGFKWTSDTNQFTYDSMEALDPVVWNALDMRLTFTVDYPAKGLRVLEIDQGTEDFIEQTLAYLLEVEEKSGTIKSKEEISINQYKCDSKREPLNLCSLFVNFPEENIDKNLISMTSFPSSNGSADELPPRFFVYYRETPTKKKKTECFGCYNSKRYLMVGKNVSSDHRINETKWYPDNTSTNPCVDLNGVIVNASSDLTDYLPNDQGFYFDLMEFSGTSYTISRVQISSDLKVLADLKIQKSGPIGDLFKCKQPPTTPPPLPTDEITDNEIFCEENNGNIQIKTAFRLNSYLYFFGKDDQNYKVSGLKWTPDTNQFTYDSMEALNLRVWDSLDMKLTFTVDYPAKGPRVLEIDYANEDSGEQLVAYLLEVEEKSGTIKSREEISINQNNCGSKREPLNLCSLFAIFPQENIDKNLISMTSFPPSNGSAGRLPPRIFVYFRETPTEKKTNNDCFGCCKWKRYLIVGKTVSSDNQLNDINWHLDNTSTNPCVDLKGVIVNASLDLTDYIPNGQGFDFFLMEFSGTTYTISRVQISSDLKVLADSKIQKSGPIGELFNCKQPPTTPPPFSTEVSTDLEIPSTTEVPRTQESGETKAELSSTEGTPTPTPTQTPTQTSTQTSNPTPTPLKTERGFPVILIVLIVLFLVIIIGVGVIAWYFIFRHTWGSYALLPVEQNPGGSGPSVDITEAAVTPTPSDTKTIVTSK